MRLYPLTKRNYELIDPIIQRWVSINSLQLYKECKDVEIRSVLFCDDGGNVRFQLWIDPLEDDRSISISVLEVKKFIWERKATKPINFAASIETLEQTLNDALAIVRARL